MNQTGNWYHNLRFINHLPALQGLSKGENVYPIMCEVDLTDYCNHDCVWCIDRDNRKKDLEFSLKQIFQVFDEFSQNGVRSVVLKGGGEPTTFHHFTQVVKRLKENGISIGLITNGAKLMDDEIRQAVLENCEWVRISLDAATTELHDKLHRPEKDARLPHIMEGASKLIQAAEGTRLVVGFNFVFHEINQHEILPAVELVRDLGAKYLALRPVIPNSLTKREELIPPAIQTLLVEAKQLEVENFKVLIADHGYVHQGDSPCRSHSMIGIVRTDGNMTPCCFLKDEKDMFFGNVLRDGLKTVWESEQRQNVLKMIENNECRHVCARAGTDRARRYWEYNQIIQYLENEAKQRHVEFV